MARDGEKLLLLFSLFSSVLEKSFQQRLWTFTASLGKV